MTKPTKPDPKDYRPVTAEEFKAWWAAEQKRRAKKAQRNELINSARTPFVFAPRKMWRA